MANVFLGVSLIFGTAATTAIPAGTAASALQISNTNMLLQDEDQDKEAKMDDVADADGITVQRTIYDPSEKATFTYIVKAASAAALTTFLATAYFPEIGAIGTVTNTVDTRIAGTNWIVIGAKKTKSNKTAMKVTINLERFTGEGAISAVTG